MTEFIEFFKDKKYYYLSVNLADYEDYEVIDRYGEFQNVELTEFEIKEILKK